MPEPERLPIESPDEGLYIHRAGGRGVGGTRVVIIERYTDDLEPEYLVDARQFMEIQRERDNFRRTLALVNAAHRLRRGRSLVDTLLSDAGFELTEAHAMASIAAQVVHDHDQRQAVERA